MTPIAIHQFSISCHYGDGITNGMLFTRRLLRKAGIVSDIFSIEVDDRLTEDILPHDVYSGSADNLLLIHHGIGNGAEPWLKSLPDKKMMVFHNITPSSFFPPDDPIQPLLEQGWRQLDDWREWLAGAIADSETNLDILIRHDYDRDYCRTIPLLVDLSKITTSVPVPSSRPIDDIFHLLFVGRLMPHKNQLGLIYALSHLRQMTGLNVHLTLVGAGDITYTSLLEKSAIELGLSSVVHFAGKASDSELAGYFSRSDLYISLSQHEGFGIPLIESMAHCLPVIAFDAPGSNVAKTLGEAGILFDSDDPMALAAIISSVIKQPLLRRELVKKGLLQLECFTEEKVYSELYEFLQSIGIVIPEMNFEKEQRLVSDFRLEGPFDSSYSLAIVNSNLALALAESGGKLALHATEGPGDYSPDEGFLKQNPMLLELYNTSPAYGGAITVLRLMYPTRLSGMNGINNGLSCYGWEESSVPHSTIEQINCHAHFVTTMSEYVTRTLIDNGANVPIFTTGIGADHILQHQPDPAELPDLGSGFRILHISSCFPRKGVDALLEAYGERFNNEHDITLIIKTFPNPHHDIDGMIDEWRRVNPAAPVVIVINRDLSNGAIRALYQQCHVLAAPSRGEGFGLPMAEAMLHRLPVVTTNFGGQTDFCSDDTAWLVDYTFRYAKTHMGMSDSVWADPDTQHLAETISQLYQAFRTDRWEEATGDKLDKAFELVNGRHTWSAVCSKYQDVLQQLDDFPIVKQRPKLGCITTWSSKCGIATYSKLLLEPALGECRIFANSDADLLTPDGGDIVRCWQSGHDDNLDDLYNAIILSGIDQLLIQFNFSFFDFKAFKRLLHRLNSSDIDIFITFHSTADVSDGDSHKSLKHFQPELQDTARIFVHSVTDLVNLKEFGLAKNASLFPHGVKTDVPISDISQAATQLEGKIIISSYGFLLPHKGIRNLIRAFSNIASSYPDAHLLLVNAEYPVGASIQEAVECRRLIQDLAIVDRVTLITDFLEDSESLSWLSMSSCILFPYEHTQESSSAAVRWGLTTGKPVYCTPLPIFDDVREVVEFFPGCDIASIEEGLSRLLTDRATDRKELETRQLQWLKDHDWSHLSERLRNLLQSHKINTRHNGPP
jgi:glycosyltransferase involved in cell wall biosynthesis